MPTARESWDEFVRTAWNKRDDIMAPLEGDKGTEMERTLKCVKVIYNIYNAGDLTKMPNWQNLLSLGARAFIDRCKAREFWFQSESKTRISGQELGEALGKLCLDAIKTKSFSIPRVPLSGQKINETLKGFVKARKSGMITKETFNSMVAQIKGISSKKRMETDPALVLNQFVWHQPPGKRSSGGKYRIYVAPTLEHTIPVYCDMVEDLMNGTGAIGSIPTKLKVGTPTPNGSNRVDRIVVYCANEAEMNGGVEWLRDYQQTRRAKFQSMVPLATKPVDGLLGVSITPQPKPEHSIMVKAGRNRSTSTGISFGMSRAHVIYLGLKSAYENDADFSTYKLYVEAWAKAAKLDIDLADLTVD